MSDNIMNYSELQAAVAELEFRLKGKKDRFKTCSANALPQAPSWWSIIASASVFGEDLLSVHPDIIEFRDEYSMLFEFVQPDSPTSIWEDSMLRYGCYPIACINGGDYLLYVQNNTELKAALIDHERIFDDDYFEYEITASMMTLPKFLKGVNLQTVTCYMDPKAHSRYSMIEIFNGTKIVYDKSYGLTHDRRGEKEYSEPEAAWNFYMDFAREHAGRKYKIHYCPAYVRGKLEKFFQS